MDCLSPMSLIERALIDFDGAAQFVERTIWHSIPVNG
jgi:hypothetical protein